jgi:DNA polymerase-2
MRTDSVQNNIDCFLLTRQWRDTPQGVELLFWASSPRGPLRIIISEQKSLFFIQRTAKLTEERGIDRRPLALNTLHGQSVDGLYFASQRQMQATARELKHQGQQVFESDVRPPERFLMERFITAGFKVSGEAVQHPGYLEFHNPKLAAADIQPAFSCLSFDIETNAMDGELYSIAAIHVAAENGKTDKRLFFHGQSMTEARSTLGADITCHDTERALLRDFFNWVKMHDPDILMGWNVVAFDLTYLEHKCRQLGIPFDLGRGRERSTILQPESNQQVPIARLPGRVVLDGIDTLRSATWSFESFGLDYVANELLGRGKLIREDVDKVAEITRLYHESPIELLQYNLEDAQLVLDIFARADLVNFAIERAKLTGLTMDRVGGSVAAFDYLYLPRLHRKGYVAPDIGDYETLASSPGGYVMDSFPGLYENVLVLDFKSLYPSIIRTFHIDPLGLAQPGDDPIEGFSGGQFSRRDAILPGIIAQLWEARDEAKQRRDAPMSQAIKIIMNSFYGVLGTPGCRFFNPKLASSITRRGHEIIHRSQEYIEAQGYKVIYGDTDSVFVLLGSGLEEAQCRTIGTHLAEGLNQWWTETIEREHRVPSYLEIEFETHYLKFIMPTIRGSEKGSKKRYAGLVRTDGNEHKLVFKGLESVRTDWTPLAREFQRELYRRVFLGLPFEDYIRDLADRLMAGELDEELFYRKRLRRRLEEYVKNVPPHVQAAKRLAENKRPVQGWIEYVITINGPEPRGLITSPIDYEHYLEKQLKPIANGILHFVNSDFDQLYARQIRMF